MVFCLFFGFVFYSRFKEVKIENVKYGEAYNVWASDLKFHKGYVTINDSLILPGNTSPFNDSSNTSNIKFHKNFNLYQISQPYRMVKKSKNDTIFIIQNIDTLYFKYINHEKINNNDLTFKQLFNKIFN